MEAVNFSENITPKNKDGIEYEIKYIDICPFSSKEYEGTTIAKFINGFFWFDNEYGQEQFRTKQNITLIKEIQK